MESVSVVIITKNEAVNIVDCIQSAKLISDDIIVVDAESDDETVFLANSQGVRVLSLVWKGYGHARNSGANIARHDWVLALDADERITPSFQKSLKKLTPDTESCIYGFKRKNYFRGKEIKFGLFGFDKIYRLYNRKNVFWESSPVHEELNGTIRKKKYLNCWINHFAIRNQLQYKNKSIHYAHLCAIKYLQEGRKSNFIKRFFSARFNFIKTYIFLLGFLDGEIGFFTASLNAYYTALKYQLLKELNDNRIKS